MDWTTTDLNDFETESGFLEGEPIDCSYCGGPICGEESLDDFRFLAVNDLACLGCMNRLAEEALT